MICIYCCARIGKQMQQDVTKQSSTKWFGLAFLYCIYVIKKHYRALYTFYDTEYHTLEFVCFNFIPIIFNLLLV